MAFLKHWGYVEGTIHCLVNYSMTYISGIRSIVLKFVQNSPYSSKSTIVRSTLLMLPCKIQCLYIIIVISNKIKLISTYELKGMGHIKD